MDEAHVSVLGMQRTISHTGNSHNVNNAVSVTSDPTESDLAVGFIYAIRSHWKKFGVKRKPKPYELDIDSVPEKLPRESAFEFHGRLYHLNTHNLQIVTTPRRVLDKRAELPDGLTKAQCRFYCAALDKGSFDDTLARRAAPVALWVLENIE